MTDLYPEIDRDAEDILSRVREAMPTADEDRPVDVTDDGYERAEQ